MVCFLRPVPFGMGFCLKILSKSLLPKKLKERGSLTFEFPNIKPRFFPKFFQGFRRLKYIFAVTLLLGYYPTVSLPTNSHTSTILAAEQVAELQADSLPFAFSLPHPGYLSTPFSRYHPGIDIATGLGMPIHPVGPGQVVAVNYGFFGLGHEVIISHSGGFESVYGHMSRIYVKVGNQVTQNSTLGEVGLTGQTSGSHTHLEIRRDGKPIDPQTILPTIPHFPSPMDFQPVGGRGGEPTNLRKTLKPDFS